MLMCVLGLLVLPEWTASVRRSFLPPSFWDCGHVPVCGGGGGSAVRAGRQRDQGLVVGAWGRWSVFVRLEPDIASALDALLLLPASNLRLQEVVLQHCFLELQFLHAVHQLRKDPLVVMRQIDLVFSLIQEPAQRGVPRR